jgi:SNF2 family DNA or RNA helicase
VQAAKEDGRKVAIYSEYLHVIESVIKVATEECDLPIFGPIRGGVSPSDRLQMVQEFTDEDGPAVIVAQIQAGAVGLNIQAASVVILCEPALKPSTEEQAIARSYRMGQTRSVRVHRLLTNEGVDPLVQEMLDRKSAEFDEYVRPSALSASSEAARDSAVTATLKDFALREAERLQAEGPGSQPDNP